MPRRRSRRLDDRAGRGGPLRRRPDPRPETDERMLGHLLPRRRLLLRFEPFASFDRHPSRPDIRRFVLAADYRLAPENPAPAAHDDASRLYKWALAEGYHPSAIALTGDSAGGNLALSVAVRAKKEGLPQPWCAVLMSPALDLASEGDSHHSVTDAPLLTRA